MHTDEELYSRRHFLQWSAATAATAIALPALSQTASEPTPASQRSAPRHPLLLRNAQLEVVLDAADGLPFSYRLRANASVLHGEPFSQPLEATICCKEPWSFAKTRLKVEGYIVHQDSVVFHCSAVIARSRAASFDLHYHLYGATLILAMENVREHSGFELIDVAMPGLVSVRETDQDAWLVHGEEGGSFARLSDAKASSLPLNRFWGNVLGTVPIVMLGTASAMCVQETTAFMDGTLLSVTSANGQRCATLGTDKVHRVNGGECYDLNLGNGLPRNCGTAATPNLLVDQISTCRLDFIPVTGDPAKAWIHAGKAVRARMPAIPTDFYNDKYVYGLRCDEPLFPQPSTTFAQCEDFIARLAALTDNSPQVTHLWGWQFRGKDTGYPAVNEVNPRIGGYDGMMRLMENARKYNATVTLSDNYDDAYRSSPAWDSAAIARRPDGDLWKSRAWTGEPSYILGLAKYMEGPGPERVRYTCERYRLQHTTHIDVLSYYAIRNDWDPQHPASGIRNLEQGRYKVLEEFRAHGVDVSSGALRYPMIGHICCFWYLTGPGPCTFGGTPIPLVPLLYGRSAVWGLSGAGAKGDPAFVRILERFYGAAPHSMMRHDTDPAQFLDAFYLGMVPFFALRGRSIDNFERNGDSTRIILERGAVIESDPVAQHISITLDDVEVLHDDYLVCPFPRSGKPTPATDRIACYSITERDIDVPLPRDWNSRDVVATTLHGDKRESASIQPATDGTIRLHLAARQPVILYRNSRAASA